MSWLMTWVAFRSPEIALTGQFLAQTVQPVQGPSKISNLIRLLHTFAGHRFS